MGQGKICVDEEKFEAIKNWKLPKKQNTVEKLSRICQFFSIISFQITVN